MGCCWLTTQGQLIVEEDLAAALNKQVAGAAVDVVAQEPIREDNPLLAAKLYYNPHISWALGGQHLLAIAVDSLACFLALAKSLDHKREINIILYCSKFQ